MYCLNIKYEKVCRDCLIAVVEAGTNLHGAARQCDGASHMPGLRCTLKSRLHSTEQMEGPDQV